MFKILHPVEGTIINPHTVNSSWILISRHDQLMNVLHLKSVALAAAILSIHFYWDETPCCWVIGDVDIEGNGCFGTSGATGARAQFHIPGDLNHVLHLLL